MVNPHGQVVLGQIKKAALISEKKSSISFPHVLVVELKQTFITSEREARSEFLLIYTKI